MCNNNRFSKSEESSHHGNPHLSPEIQNSLREFIKWWIFHSHGITNKLQIPQEIEPHFNKVYYGGLPETDCNCSDCDTMRQIKKQLGLP